MGNCVSSHSTTYYEQLCVICKDKIDTTEKIKCNWCKANIHKHCFDRYADIPNNMCPKCEKIGFLRNIDRTPYMPPA